MVPQCSFITVCIFYSDVAEVSIKRRKKETGECVHFTVCFFYSLKLVIPQSTHPLYSLYKQVCGKFCQYLTHVVGRWMVRGSSYHAGNYLRDGHWAMKIIYV